MVFKISGHVFNNKPVLYSIHESFDSISVSVIWVRFRDIARNIGVAGYLRTQLNQS